MNNPQKLLGAQIATWRKSDGLTQKALSQKCGVPLTAIRRCEQKGEIPLSRYIQLASALGATLLAVKSEPKFRSLEEVLAAQTARNKTSRKPKIGSIFEPA